MQPCFCSVFLLIPNEKVSTYIRVVCKIALNFAASSRLRPRRTCRRVDMVSRPLFVCIICKCRNVNKNKITSSETNIIVCLSEIE